MITRQMSAAAEAAAQRYGLLVEGWRLLFTRAVSEQDFGSARQIARIKNNAYEMARSYINTELNLIGTEFEQIALEAQGSTLSSLAIPLAQELSVDALELTGASIDYLRTELSVQIERDIAWLVQSVRSANLQVVVSASSRGVPRQTAVLEYRIGNASELQFFFHDRRNQKWPSRKFVRAIWRHSLLNLYNETVLLTLAEAGQGTAVVVHANPQSDNHGMQVSLSSSSELPTYGEIRAEVFHPNSDAILAWKLP